MAYVDEGKIYVLKAGTSDMIVDYEDGTKGYFRINVMDDADESIADDSQTSAQAAIDVNDDDSKRKTLKITIIIVIVCVAIALLVMEYFIILNHQRKKAKKKQNARRRYEDDDDDDDDDDVNRLELPSDEIAPDEDGYDNDQSYTYPTNSKVNDYADFLKGDESEDIMFTAPVAKKPETIKRDINDFTLSQGGSINRFDDDD